MIEAALMPEACGREASASLRNLRRVPAQASLRGGRGALRRGAP